MLYPDFLADLMHLPVKKLQSRGVKVLAFDLDHTLAPGRTRQINPEYVEYLAALRRAGFKLVLASNTLHDISSLAVSLDATIVPATLFSRKPLKRYFNRLIKTTGCHPNEVAMIGDRIINDIVGANRSGLITIKIDPIGRPKSLSQRLYDSWVKTVS